MNQLKMLRERQEGSKIFWRCNENQSEGDTHPMGDNSPGKATGTGQEEIDFETTRYDVHLVDNT